jgi:ABC-2 type transport system permease protein
MAASVLRKSVRDQRRALFFWAVGLVGLIGMYVGIYPSMRGSTGYSDIIDKMPESLRALFVASGVGDVTTGPGFLYVELLSFMAPMLVLLYAVGAGSGAVAGEESRRTLDLLLASPVSRTRLVVEKVAAMVVGLGVLGVTLVVATIGLGALADMGLSSANVVATMAHLVMLGLVFGALALFVGCLTGRPALSRGVAAMVAVVTYLVNGFGLTVDWLRPLRPLSPFYQYLAHDPIRHGLAPGALAVALATAVVLVVAAAWVFERRDVTG